MATYVNDLRLKEIATGDESGTWGDSTNTNLELIAEAFSYATEAAFSSDADATSTIGDGISDPARSLYYKVTSGASLSATRTLTLAPNTVSKIWIIENATTGGQSINISQGSGANVTIPNGQVKVVYSDGAGSGAAVVDAFTDLEVGATFKVGTNLTVGGTYTGGGLMTTGGNIVIPNAGNIGSASDTDAIAISSSGVVTLSQIPVFSLGLGATSFNDQNITNVGSISLDSIASDAGSTITVTLGTDAGDNFIVGNNNAFVVEGDTDRVGIGTATPAVALDVGSETDAILVAKGTTAQRPTGAAGQFRYNTTLGKFEGYTTEWGEIGGGTSTNTFETDIFTGDGSDTTFTLSQAVDENNLFVFIDGVFQAQNSYSVSGTTLTFSTAPANSRVITVYSVVGAVAGGNFALATMTGDDSDTTLTLPFNPVNENNLSVYIDGVYQNKDTFSVSGSTLTFSEAPPTGTKVEAMIATQTSVNTATILQDADQDTKVQVEESSDEDKIRFDTAGSERVVIDSTGLIGMPAIGQTHPVGGQAKLAINSTDAAGASLSIHRHYAGLFGGYLVFQKSRNTDITNLGVVSNNDILGSIEFTGADGNSYAQGAHIRASVDGTPGDGDMPTRLTFSTSADGSAIPTERLRILSSGGITFNGDTAAANALDDYEEGTWTPAFYTYSGVTTSSITITLATYTKIGNICHIHANITATLSSLPGQTVTITGLPFAASGSDQYAIIAVGGHTVNTGANTPKAHFRTNGSQLDGVYYNASSNTAFWNYSSMDAQPFEMSIHGFYTTT